MVERTQAERTPLTRILLLIFGTISFEFLIMGISLGLLPGFVHTTLHFNNVMVGVVVGLQYVATLLTRHLAGKSADMKGGKVTVTIGLALSALSGLCCLIAIFFTANAILCLIILMLARILLGVGESYLVVGMFAWGFVLVGSKNTGKVMVWTGLGMHGGMALGAPAGLFLLTSFGNETAFATMVGMPFLGYLLTLLLPSIPLPQLEKRLPFYHAIKLVWKAGTGLAMASIGFSGIASFITLYFAQKGWDNAPLALSAFGTGYLVMRLFFAHFPDKFGGAKVAIVCLVVESIGQTCIWQAPNGLVAILGAILTGCGMSLVFPSFGQLAIKAISPSNRGMAMAAYNAFFDLGMGLTAPLAGLIAGGVHYEYIYLFGAVAAIVGLVIAYQELSSEKANWAT
ncbi:MFS transporter [Spirosoma endophyticum]|uniref:Predicted arabinose efflux permease, MFS family n=1 Tax=Spirosoma endophyticum TaxID=662367 RepID=A0A1I2DT25_9BACT|nr:MFS transporter [Spirosoma endophyticum]SFE83782.1 Predicted arabinose efflux permease, MFS family [Spirosoma endophyticum]